MLARVRVPLPPGPIDALTAAIRRVFPALNPKSRGGSNAAPTCARIVPVLDVPIANDVNLLWCGAFQLAWNEACDRFKGPIELSPPSALASQLNAADFHRRCIDEDSIVVAAGAVDDGILKKIKGRARRMSREEDRLLKKAAATRADFICYARLSKSLSFPKPFIRLGNYALGGRDTPCFGFLQESKNSERQREQTLIHDYRSPDDFVVELKTRESEDMLVFAKVPAAENLRETARGVIERLQLEPEPAGGRDMLVAPCISFSDIAEFSELQGRKVVSNETWFLTSALQSIDFAIDEKGVILISIGLVSFARGLGSLPARFMELKPPFLLLMKQKDGREPYFVCWIANHDLLKRR